MSASTSLMKKPFSFIRQPAGESNKILVSTHLFSPHLVSIIHDSWSLLTDFPISVHLTPSGGTAFVFNAHSCLHFDDPHDCLLIQHPVCTNSAFSCYFVPERRADCLHRLYIGNFMRHLFNYSSLSLQFSRDFPNNDLALGPKVNPLSILPWLLWSVRQR